MLTHGWGSHQDVSLYLNRCQVDTEEPLVHRVWQQVLLRRRAIGKVVDFGAGDGRFSRAGAYKSYVGYEIDSSRFGKAALPQDARMEQGCAFSTQISDADLTIGNPPYVRNQDLPQGWREHAAQVIESRTSVTPSGLANAWQYFFLLSLASTAPDGLVALVIPFEWVSRPSSKSLRNYIRQNNWNVAVYRLNDSAFYRVLTTSSITIVDKSRQEGAWTFYAEDDGGHFTQMPSETGHVDGVLPYLRATQTNSGMRAKRGLSPGTQEILTLTESERARLGLRPGEDVVECVTSLRHLPASIGALNTEAFRKHFRDEGKKCWLIRTDVAPSKTLMSYLSSVAEGKRATATCRDRDEWWKFTMPSVPHLLVSSGFRGDGTKSVVNTVKARAVGSVCGVYGVPRESRDRVASQIREFSLGARVVAHSNGLKKLEINQINAVLESLGDKENA
jgi:hypothetical protein